MKRIRVLFAGAALAVAALVTACSGTATTASDENDSEAPRIKYVVNGTLGDKSFIDSANRGLTQAVDELGYELKIVELGLDESGWESGLADAAAGDDYDILVAGSYSMSDYVGRVAPDYPEKMFWVYDAPPDYTGEIGCSNKCENVYSVTFKQNEGSYLVGYLMAELIADGQLPNAEGLSKVGVVGAQDIPVINDFVAGFTGGFVDGGGSESDVLVQYIGGDKAFNDPARGKEIASAIFDAGAAAVWGVAGGSGAGVMEAAAERDLYSIGVDSDQYLTVADETLRDTIITSMVKNVDAALFRAADLHLKGELPYGEAEIIGIAEDGVVIATENENFARLVPATVAESVQAALESVKTGQTKVPTAF
ncbi:BMP family ABC transporter substrate-binding protein [Microbacterium lushaniae]|uniref:BMP family ABC transporter substrate-binding protein n=1 Tax=Microbacterium lushaniae TaxID=2614639 RepID=A0A5J6L1A0_9MICO|nr:BMP family ABC transporter substrate-binding protein [Microbacterium lushaniae]QEW02273.1 BMP family ABC transporter substrate-binding protein [Microbacterium lushaniae]